MQQPTNAGPEAIMQMMQGAQVAGILAAAVQLDVFAQLADGARTAPQVAERIGAPARSTRILLDALAALGLLEKQSRDYALGPLAQAHLVPGRPAYLGDVTRIFGGSVLFTAMAHIADAVKNDGTVLHEHAETPQHQFWEVFAEASPAFAVPGAMALDGLVAEWLGARDRVRVLDIAAGSGVYGLTLARHANVELTLLDWPNVLARAREAGKRMAMDERRVRFIEGDLFTVDYQGPYDLILLSHVYHHFDRETCARLTRRVADALAPGGRVAVQDFVFDETLANPMPALFAVTMLVWTRKGESFAEADYARWFEAAGLRHAGTHPSLGMPASWLLADKP